MIDRLYCPDFSSVFGEAFRNPYEYPMIDSLVWPTLLDVKLPPEGEKLLKITSDGVHPVFYRRKITINQLIAEFKASGLEGGCLQAIDLGRDYGISSTVVIDFCKKYPNLLFPIISPRLTPAGIKEFLTQVDSAVAVVIYPSYQKLDLANPNTELEEICKICADRNCPLKSI